MSDETRAELEVALAAHVKDEMDGAMVTGWAMVTTCVHPEHMASNGYWHDCPPDQPFHVTVGLLQMGVWNQKQHYDEDDE